MSVQHQISNPSVFLTTEDPVALAEFLKAAPKSWKKVLVYKPAVSSDSSVHSQAQEAQLNSGASGRHALIALLLALEARFFVLTGASNWSRLINELRGSVLDVDCAQLLQKRAHTTQLLSIPSDLSSGVNETAGSCATDVIDLQPHMKHIKHGFLRPVSDAESADPIHGFRHNAPESATVSTTRRLHNAAFSNPVHNTSVSPMLTTAQSLASAATPVERESQNSIKAPLLSTTFPSGEWKRVGGAANEEKFPRSYKRREARISKSRRLQEGESLSSSSTSGHEHVLHGGSCTCSFLKYTPAPIEARWTANIEAWQVTNT